MILQKRTDTPPSGCITRGTNAGASKGAAQYADGVEMEADVFRHFSLKKRVVNRQPVDRAYAEIGKSCGRATADSVQKALCG